MSPVAPFPSRTALGRREARIQRAQDALAICAGADTLAVQAVGVVGVDDERLFALLEQREQMLSDLAEHIVALQLERPTADNPLFAASERMVDDADQLISTVCEALTRSHRATMALAMRVEQRVAELRAELASVQRAGSAGLAYTAMGGMHHVDRVR
ncbi:MAG: hypothetical protein V4617_18355 [Gemmatimonadota bacterium]